MDLMIMLHAKLCLSTPQCLNAYNKVWLEELAKQILEAEWENDPYPSALANETSSGLSKISELHSNHL
jgi:hypothetical protein